jgi:hypothetical protein
MMQDYQTMSKKINFEAIRENITDFLDKFVKFIGYG